MAEVPYWKYSSDGSKNLMTVPEMRKMLGLKKTDGYWLLHKGNFKVYEEDGKYLIDTESFENWYANQVKYSKVDGPAPGDELKKKSYSIRDIAEMLGLCEGYVYEIFERDQVETITVDYVKRVPKDAFDKWYHGQSRFRTAEDKEKDRELEDASIWLPDVARMLNVDRSRVYHLMYNDATKDQFEVIEVACRKRVTKESFYRWYDNQDQYSLLSEEDMREKEEYRLEEIRRRRLKKLSSRHRASSKNAGIYNLKEPKNPRFYTINEITELYGFTRNTIMRWINTGMVPAIRVGRSYRLPRGEFDDWLDLKST